MLSGERGDHRVRDHREPCLQSFGCIWSSSLHWMVTQKPSQHQGSS